MPSSALVPQFRGRVLMPCLVGIVLGISACGEDPNTSSQTTEPTATAGLGLELEPSAAAPGDLVAARVVNGTGDSFTYGAGYELGREFDGAFVPIGLGDRAVIQVAYVAEPGRTGPPVRVRVPAKAEPGRWRVVLATEAPDGGELAAEFEVVARG